MDLIQAAARNQAAWADKQIRADLQADRTSAHRRTVGCVQGFNDGHRFGVERDNLEWNRASSLLNAHTVG